MIKFFILFVFGISFLFFSLIFFQEQSIKKHPPIPPSEFVIQGNIQPMPPSMPPNGMHPEIEEPPIYVPCIFVVLLSSIFLFILFRYLDKNFIAPLLLIESKLKEINQGNLNVKFETKSENKAVLDTFKILNSMVLGLIEKEKLQDEFIQNLAHDLRSPVVAQERAIAILKDEFKDHELLDGLLQNSETYLKMINLIIEAHNKREITVNKIKIDFKNLVNVIFNALKPLSDTKNIQLVNNVAPEAFVYADYVSMNRIIMNLVSNSIENIGFDKTIKVSLENKTDKTIIVVEDNGQGIAKENQDRIFSKYVSNNKSGKKAISGLGLYIVKELIQKNSGQITLQSEENKYTKFIMEFPNEKM